MNPSLNGFVLAVIYDREWWFYWDEKPPLLKSQRI
jgi:hypothetical protein